jgi:hypothetical protein
MGEDREHQTDKERDATTTEPEPPDDGTAAEKMPSSESPDDEAYTPLTPTTT